MDKDRDFNAAIAAYVHELENESPVVSYSHITYRNLVLRYGAERVQNAIDAAFRRAK